MNESNKNEVLFVISGESKEMKTLCEIYSKRLSDSIHVSKNKLIISSTHKVDGSLSDHLDWILSCLKNDFDLIKEAVRLGDYISFSYFYTVSQPLGFVLEPSTSGLLNELNAPLFFYLSANQKEKPNLKNRVNVSDDPKLIKIEEAIARFKEKRVNKKY